MGSKIIDPVHLDTIYHRYCRKLSWTRLKKIRDDVLYLWNSNLISYIWEWQLYKKDGEWVMSNLVFIRKELNHDIPDCGKKIHDFIMRKSMRFIADHEMGLDI